MWKRMPVVKGEFFAGKDYPMTPEEIDNEPLSPMAPWLVIIIVATAAYQIAYHVALGK